MSPRILIAVVVSIIGGLLLGRIGPQADLRRANERIDELQKDLAKHTRTGAGATISGVKSMFKVSDQDLDAGAKARRARDAEAKATNIEAVANSATNAVTQAVPFANTQHVARTSFSNEIENLKKAWAARADIARTNFVTKTKLDEKQTQDFQTLVDAMNVRIGAAIDKWAAKIKQDGGVQPETGVRMMTDLGSAMVTTYDEMDRKLPADWRQNAGANFELVNFVDPEVLTPLQDVENIIPPGNPNGPRRRGRMGMGMGGP